MNNHNVLTEQELNAVSGGDKSTVAVTKTKVEEVKLGAESSAVTVISSAGSLLGAGPPL